MKAKLILLILFLSFFYSCQENKGDYVCIPCDLPCDELNFTKSGICPHCDMKLIKKSDLKEEKQLTLNKINIIEGSGEFLIEGGLGKINKPIKVFYHRPKNYQSDSNILIVIPGAGRNGDSYRDAWIEESEKYGVLILSPMYSKKEYNFEDYHLCGLISDSNLKNCVEFIENSNIALLNEDNFTFKENTNQKEWIFNDFDRIFNLVVDSLNSKQTKYDIFGHSAGGQILHRLAIFHTNSNVDRILASNSGFYTLTDFEILLPFGIKNTLINEKDLQASFQNKLVLFIGELDNENEKGGTLLRSKTADTQGLHRLQRAKYFYNYSKEKALKMGVDFNWELKIVPNIGHNYIEMGNAAAMYLYGQKKE